MKPEQSSVSCSPTKAERSHDRWSAGFSLNGPLLPFSIQAKVCTPTASCALLALVFAWVFGSALTAAPPPRDLALLIVVGAPGAPEYHKPFQDEAALLKDACTKAGLPSTLIGLDPEDTKQTDATRLQSWLTQAAKDNPARAVWLVLIGHGTFDGREAKFNLRGPDITAPDLATWLKPLTGEVAVIQTASASAPFLKALAAPNRVLISATKSADQVFYTRFGTFFAKAISGDPAADLDRDRQVSLLEAFLWASKQVTRFFETAGRLATEHALIEDDGDGTGTRAESFTGLRLTTPPADGKPGDGQLARQRSLLLNDDDARLTEPQRRTRDDLERQVEALRVKKAQMPEADYYTQLEKLLLEIARLYGS